MRAGLSTIQQTLTPEAANVLNLSIAEAGRRNHGQTTPLHVAATLLASPSGFLRQACIRSHPNSSHPLQCRALELCFSVALERLPSAQNLSPGMEPPISNALMAALKRAQAHQRRGCPEQQQQPLLAVKVELDQLIISILDDPSVSRVMREASFSSPAVKATIEQSLNSQTNANNNPSTIGIGFRPTPAPMPIPNRNLYLNPRLQQGSLAQPGQQRNDEVKRVVDILLRTKRRNPVLVGESEPEAVIKELLRRIEKREFSVGVLKNVEVITIEKEILNDKSQIPMKIKELGGLIETRIGNCNGGGGIIVDLGDLKWIVEQPVSFGVPGSGGVQQQQQVASETGRAAVVEMAKLLAKFGEGSNGRVWLIGTATCETYLRCQVYHPTMENDWDLQAVPITPRSPLPGLFPRLGANGIRSTSVDTLNPLKSFPTGATALTRRVPENSDPAPRMNCCPKCSENYEQELANLVAKECEKSSELKSEATRSSLPQWLQNAKVPNDDGKLTDQSLSKDQDVVFKQKSQELQKKWSDKCLHLHPNYHKSVGSERIVPTPFTMTGMFTSNPLLRQQLQPKLQPTRNLGQALVLNSNQIVNPTLVPINNPPGSPVRTDLVLGQTKVTEQTRQKTEEVQVKDFLGCISSEPPPSKFASELDADSFKKLLKGLMEKAWWQPEAASAIASAVTRCKWGNGRRRGAGSRGDTWLLFTGPDRVGKKKMASVLSEQICGANPIMICLGSRRDDEETDNIFRGKTALDRIVEAVRRNPFSVIMLQDIDEADMLIRGSIKRAMERGRLADSHGREISLGNVIFILTGNWSTVNPRSHEQCLDERKLASTSSGGAKFRLTIGERSVKRRANWLHDEDRPTRSRKEMSSGLSLDLNLAADAEDDRTDGSHNSSDLTVDHEEELGLENVQFSIASVPHELISTADDVIVFKPADFALIGCEIRKTIMKRFSIVLEDKLSIEVDDNAVENILWGVWHGRSSLDEWVEKVIAPSFEHLKERLPFGSLTSLDEMRVVRLELDSDSDSRSNADWLPSQITVMVDQA